MDVPKRQVLRTQGPTGLDAATLTARPWHRYLRRITRTPCFSGEAVFSLAHGTGSLERDSHPLCANSIAEAQDDCRVIEDEDVARISRVMPVHRHVAHLPRLRPLFHCLTLCR